jgi:hypothetical protein
LLQDLRPRHSQAPEAAPHSVSLPPDSLVPHAVSEVPSAPLPASLPPASLDDEDLAVLPSRRGAGLRTRWRHAVVLAALLTLAGALIWVGMAPPAEQAAGEVAAAASAPMMAAPLPPPPPPEGMELEAEPLPEAAPAAASRGHASEDDFDPESDERGPRGRRAGDAIARFADLPGATLSRLARDERQKARSRAPRSAKAASSAAKADPGAAKADTSAAKADTSPAAP